MTSASNAFVNKQRITCANITVIYRLQTILFCFALSMGRTVSSGTRGALSFTSGYSLGV